MLKANQSQDDPRRPLLTLSVPLVDEPELEFVHEQFTRERKPTISGVSWRFWGVFARIMVPAVAREQQKRPREAFSVELNS